MRKLIVIIALFLVSISTFNTYIEIDVTSGINANKRRIIEAIIYVESRGKPNAHNKSTDAVGVLQIRRILVDEVNRLYKTTYSYEDRWDVDKGIEMFHLIQNNYNPTWDLERAARIWNGGPSGMKKKATINYYKQVKQKHDEKFSNLYYFSNSTSVLSVTNGK